MGFDKAENEPSTVCYKGLASYNYITWIRYSQPRSRLLSDRAGSAARRAAGRQAGTAASRHEGRAQIVIRDDHQAPGRLLSLLLPLSACIASRALYETVLERTFENSLVGP